MSTKRLAWVTRPNEYPAIVGLHAYVIDNYPVISTRLDHIPDVKEGYDGLIVFGMGQVQREKAFLVQIDALKLPCIYIYTLAQPKLPKVATLEAPCSLDEFKKLFIKTFGFDS